MKVVAIDGEWGVDNLRMVERPDPDPGPGDVVVAMKAASLNYRDILTIDGSYNPRQPLPLIPLSDGVGEVVAIGEGVTRVAVGDRVCPIFCQKWMSGEPSRERLRSSLGGPLDGVLAERAVFHEDGLVVPPAHLTDEEAACLPCAAVTAWSALFTQGRVTAGSSVLVQGTGGVSIFALQLAKLAGARVIATSSSDAKLERVRALGADETINYRDEPKWGRLARKLAGGEGVDHIVEVGGAGTLAQSLRAVRIGGHISVIGVLAGAQQPINVLPILMQNVRLQGVLVGHRDSFDAMNQAIAAATLRPVVDHVFGFDEVPEAIAHMRAGKHFGKVAIRIAT